MLNLRLAHLLRGEITLRVRSLTRPDRVIRVPNLITDVGLNALNSGYIDWACAVGGGTTPPAVTDSALEEEFARVGRKSATFTILDQSQEYAAYLQTLYEFPFGSLIGQPINEIGIFPTTGSSLLWSRILLPSTLVLLSDESLQISYGLYTYVDLEQAIQQISYDGVDYTITKQVADVDNTNTRGYSGGTGARLFSSSGGANVNPQVFETNSLPAIVDSLGSGTSCNALTRDVYVDQSLEQTGSAQWYQNTANFVTGIGTLLVPTSLAYWYFAFNPKIPKDETKHLTLGVSMSWGRR